MSSDMCCQHVQDAESLKQLLKCATEELESARAAAAAQSQLHEARVRYLEEQLNVVRRERDETREQLERVEQRLMLSQNRQNSAGPTSSNNTTVGGNNGVTGSAAGTGPGQGLSPGGDQVVGTRFDGVARETGAGMTRVEAVAMMNEPSRATLSEVRRHIQEQQQQQQQQQQLGHHLVQHQHLMQQQQQQLEGLVQQQQHEKQTLELELQGDLQQQQQQQQQFLGLDMVTASSTGASTGDIQLQQAPLGQQQIHQALVMDLQDIAQETLQQQQLHHLKQQLELRAIHQAQAQVHAAAQQQQGSSSEVTHSSQQLQPMQMKLSAVDAEMHKQMKLNMAAAAVAADRSAQLQIHLDLDPRVGGALEESAAIGEAAQQLHLELQAAMDQPLEMNMPGAMEEAQQVPALVAQVDMSMDMDVEAAKGIHLSQSSLASTSQQFGLEIPLDEQQQQQQQVHHMDIGDHHQVVQRDQQQQLQMKAQKGADVVPSIQDQQQAQHEQVHCHIVSAQNQLQAQKEQHQHQHQQLELQHQQLAELQQQQSQQMALASSPSLLSRSILPLASLGSPASWPPASSAPQVTPISPLQIPLIGHLPRMSGLPAAAINPIPPAPLPSSLNPRMLGGPASLLLDQVAPGAHSSVSASGGGVMTSMRPTQRTLPEPPRTDLETLLKTMPQQGQLVKAVLESGPLLHQLMAATPVTQWRQMALPGGTLDSATASIYAAQLSVPGGTQVPAVILGHEPSQVASHRYLNHSNVSSLHVHSTGGLHVSTGRQAAQLSNPVPTSLGPGAAQNGISPAISPRAPLPRSLSHSHLAQNGFPQDLQGLPPLPNLANGHSQVQAPHRHLRPALEYGVLQ